MPAVDDLSERLHPAVLWGGVGIKGLQKWCQNNGEFKSFTKNMSDAMQRAETIISIVLRANDNIDYAFAYKKIFTAPVGIRIE